MNNGIRVLTDKEQRIADYADRRIEEIKSLKEAYFALVNAVRLNTTASQFQFEDAVISMEQTLDDLLISDFNDFVEMSGSLEKLSRSAIYQKWLNSDVRAEVAAENRIAARSVITNPATLAKIGVEL